MSETHLPTIDELLRPPTDAEVKAALGQFAANVREHYGDRLKGIYLFGSRARGDHRPDSDADVAVVLEDGEWIKWQERRELNWLAYQPSLDSGLDIQPWPFSAQQWLLPEAVATPLVQSARRDAIPLKCTR